MLNELYDLYQSMKSAGIVLESWHKNYKQCPKKKSFFIILNNENKITDIETLDSSKAQRYRKWEISNGFSFPSFNIPTFFKTIEEKAKKEIKTILESIEENRDIQIEEYENIYDILIEICEDAWSKNVHKKINDSLKKVSVNLSNILREESTKFEPFLELINRAQKLDSKILKNSIKKIIFNKIKQDQSSAKYWFDCFIVSSSNSVKTISLIFELEDASSFPYPANHEKISRRINSSLLKNDKNENSENNPEKHDAFGDSFSCCDSQKKYTSTTLPILGNVILRSMSSESPCQSRYKQIDAKSFRTSSSNQQKMKDSLEWISSSNKRGITWENISDSCGYNRGCIFAYPSILSSAKNPTELVGIVTPSSNNHDPDGVRFEKAAARIIPSVKGMVKEHPNAEIRIFVLVKADKGRTKVLVSKQYHAAQMIQSAKEWQLGCQNIPAIQLKLNPKSDVIDPITPFPSEIVQCLNTKWIRGGNEAYQVDTGFNIREGIALLFDQDFVLEENVRRMLRVGILHFTPLCLAIGHESHRRDGSYKKIEKKFIQYPAFVPCILGLLLSKSGCMKGEYMKNAPFLIGRMLALADILHKEYCVQVRKGDIPPQLLGNSLMQTALSNPMAGLSRLTERLPVYQAWANKTSGEGIGLAKWTLLQFGKVSDDISRLQIPQVANDEDKAQMLLGYLAKIENEEQKEESSNE